MNVHAHTSPSTPGQTSPGRADSPRPRLSLAPPPDTLPRSRVDDLFEAERLAADLADAVMIAASGPARGVISLPDLRAIHRSLSQRVRRLRGEL